MKKQFICIFLYILCLTYPATAEELKTYTYGKEPQLEYELREEPIYRTKNLTGSPIMIKIQRINEDKFMEKIKNVHYWGTSFSEKGEELNFLRVFLFNATNLTFKNMKICVQHFTVDKPYTTRTGAYHKKIFDKSKMKLYELKTYSLHYIPAHSRVVIDTPGVNLPFSRSGFIDDAWDRTHAYADDTYKTESGELYAGYIISFFHNKKLLLQMTNNKMLEEKGIKALPSGMN